MLATLTDAPFDDKNWAFEIKYDGYRALALCDGAGNVDLYSRNLQTFNTVYRDVVKELEKIKHPCLIDGEIVVEDHSGRSHFQLLQQWRQQGGTLKYYVFDVLNVDGQDVTSLTLLERKELLKLLLKNSGHLKNVFYSDHIIEKGIEFFKAAAKKNLEGIIAKRADSVYLPNQRSNDWQKIKITNEQEAVIAGFTAPKGSRKHFGSLILGAYHKGKLEYIGNCGTGFNEEALTELFKKFSKLFVEKSPFEERIKVPGKVQWLKPALVCQVKFTEWTADNSMRHPVYLGLRVDKKPKEVKREKI